MQIFIHFRVYGQVIVLAFILSSICLLEAKTLATISYKGAKGPVSINIPFEKFAKVYTNLREVAPNTPEVNQFWEDYLRYRVAVEEGYNTPHLVKNPAIRNMFADPLLRETFEQAMYKMLLEKGLKNKMAVLDKKAKKLSKSTMLKFYKKNPEYNYNFIVISFPVNPSSAQMKEAKKRAYKIYKEVRKSKKNFHDLIDIYSDDRISGRLDISRTRNIIYPTIYAQIKKMKNGQISAPVRTPSGFHIIKLNRRIPFGEANRTQIKMAYYDLERGKMLNNYVDKIKTKYKIKVNKSLLSQLL